MTPIKRFVIIAWKIFSEDYTGNLNHICTCPSQQQLEWVVWSLTELHGLDAWCEAEPDKDWSKLYA